MAEGITNSSDTLNILQKIYSVGSLYFNTADIDPAAIFGFGTWARVAQDMTLWGASADGQAGTTKAAGLPNITGSFGSANPRSFYNNTRPTAPTDALEGQVLPRPEIEPIGTTAGGGATTVAIVTDFNASKSNSIFGASTTVQPPALVVNVWRRTA